jgi:hypothetical protein
MDRGKQTQALLQKLFACRPRSVARRFRKCAADVALLVDDLVKKEKLAQRQAVARQAAAKLPATSAASAGSTP